MNQLYYGDNLEVLRDYVADESVDLVYLDPPFNSNASYNVLFAEHDGAKAAAQINAFEDTWKWDQAAAAAYQDTVEAGGPVARALTAFRTLVGDSDMLAYLSMMAPRLVELHRVLSVRGALYLHCDPTASHYLKLLLDAVFGPQAFRSEIVWKRTHAHSGGNRFGPVHDVILFYARSSQHVCRPQRVAYSDEYVERFFRFQDSDGRRYRHTILTGSGVRHGASGRPWRGINPTAANRHWAIPGYVRPLLGDPPPKDVQESLDRMDEIGRIVWPKKADGVPSFKQFLDDMTGVEAQDVWTDIPPLSSQARERLGYPTQKPEALLERILLSSSSPGDLVLDPFCGCGTTIAVAQRLERAWIGIDVTHLAIGLIKSRLRDAYGEAVAKTYTVTGEPGDATGAAELAREDPWQFEAWALGRVGARQAQGKAAKKGADRGIDGRLYFHDTPGGATRQVVLSVKGGKLKADDVRALGLVRERETAEIGVLLTLNPPTAGMRSDAASAGFYESPWGRHPRLQILTIEELLGGKGIDYPTGAANVTTRKAPRRQASQGEALTFDDGL